MYFACSKCDRHNHLRYHGDGVGGREGRVRSGIQKVGVGKVGGGRRRGARVRRIHQLALRSI